MSVRRFRYNVDCDPLEVSLGSGGVAFSPARVGVTERGGSVAAIASGQRVPESIADCDQALVLLRRLVRSGSVEERQVARIAIDDVLDRRNELVLEAARMGAQS